MVRKSPYLVLQPKVLYTLAAAILVLCGLHRPWRLLSLFSGKGLTCAVVLAVASFVVATLVHELGQLCFRGTGGPWFTRRAAVPFLLVAVVGINTMLPALDRVVFTLTKTGPFLSTAGAVYVLVALELVWIALLEQLVGADP
jgi:hypothetical protein